MRLRDRISLGISGLALAASVLLIGGALWWCQAIVAGLVALALTLQVRTRRRLARLSPLLLLLGTGIVLTLLQLIPLPQSFIAAVNGTGAELRHDGAALLGTSPWSSLSMDPPATLRALGYFVTLLGVAVLSLRFAASERGRYYLLAGVAGICALTAAITGIHELFDASALYGIYQPRQAAPPALGPLLNANHLGGLMALGTSISVGLTFYQRQASHLRVMWLLSAVGCALVAVASESRGAMIGLVLGVLATFAMLIGARITSSDTNARSPGRFAVQDLSIFLVVAVALGIAVYTTAGDVAAEIDRTSFTDINAPLSKFEAWRSSTELLAESPWFGVGRGAVEATLTRVHPASAYATYSHLENEYLTAFVDWGVPGGLLALAGLGWCLVYALRRWRDSALSAGALGGMLCVLFQSSVDFGVELLGLAVPATVVAATVLLVPFRESTVQTRTRAMRVALIVAIVACGGAITSSCARTIGEDHDYLAHATFDEAREIASHHPLDYLAYARASELTARTNPQLSVALINHAMRLHPYHAGLHRVAARLLLAHGRMAQAALEYRLAMRGTLSPQSLLHEIVTRLPHADQAATAIPEDWRPIERIMRVLSELDRSDVALAWLRKIVEQPQSGTTLIDRLYDFAMAQNDLESAAFAAKRRMATANTALSRLMLAQVEFKRKNYDQVLLVLKDVANWRSRIDEQSDAWLLMCKSYRELGNASEALECLRALERAGALVPSTSARVFELRRELEERKAAEDTLRAIDPEARLHVLEPGAAPLQ